jgi:hypothetical protein
MVLFEIGVFERPSRHAADSSTFAGKRSGVRPYIEPVRFLSGVKAVPDCMSVEAEIRRLSDLVADAEMRKDADTVAVYIASDYRGIDPSGEIIDRSILLSRYCTDVFTLTALARTDVLVLEAQTAAWECGTMEMAGHLGERTFGGTYRYTHFWRRGASGWQIAGSQMTPVSR